MNETRKSDVPEVPVKSPNNAGQPAAEEMEERGLAKGTLPQQNAPRTQSTWHEAKHVKRVATLSLPNCSGRRTCKG